MTHKITVAEVLELYGISRATLDVWRREGLKSTGKRRVNGGLTHVFDPVKLAKWCGAHGKKPKGIEGAALKGAPMPEPAKESPQPAAKRVVDPPAQLDMVRGQYASLMTRYARLVNSGGDNSEIATLSRALTQKGTELRLLEMDVLDWKKQTEMLVDYAEMQRTFVQLAGGVKERVMSLPNELAPVIREYLRDPDDVGKVHDEIRDAIVHALESLPEELPELMGDK
jgi:hypothetical protein